MRLVLTLPIVCLALGGGCTRENPDLEPRLVLESNVPTHLLSRRAEMEASFTEPGYRFIEIAQEAADVQLSVAEGTRSLGQWDAPARRATPERACVYTEAGTIKVTLFSTNASTRPDARAHVTVRSLDGPRSLLEKSVVRADCLQSAAGVALPQAGNGISTEEVQKQAELQADKYREAAARWVELGNHARAAECLLQAGWMLARQTSRYRDAISLGFKAREQFAAARNAIGESLVSILIAVPTWELIDKGYDGRGGKLHDRQNALAIVGRDLEIAVRTFDGAKAAYFSADARSHLGYNYFVSGRYADALNAYSTSESMFRAVGEIEAARIVQANLNYVRNQTTDYKKGAAAFARMVAEYPPDAAMPALADILDNSAAMHSAAGDYGNAISQFLRAWKIHEAAADFGGMARSLNGLSVTYMRLGVPAAALDYAKQSASMLRKRAGDAGPGDEAVEFTSVLLVGNAQRALGNPSAATTSHRDALNRAGSDATKLRAHLELTRDALALGDAKSARNEIQLARRYSGTDSPIQSLLVELEWCRAAAAAGGLDAARACLIALKGRFTAVGAPEYEIERVDALARTESRRGQLQAALALNGESLELLRSMRLAVSNPYLRTRLTASYRAAYELRVDLLDELRGEAKSEPRRAQLLNETFAAADEARAGLVHETAEARVLAEDVSDESPLRAIAAEIAVRENMLVNFDSGGGRGVDANDLRAQLARLRSEYDALKPPAANYRRFDSKDYGTTAMRADTAVLVLLDSSKVLRRFLVTRQGVRELPALEWTLESRTHESGKLLPDLDLLKPYPHIIVVADPLLGQLPLTAQPDATGKRLVDSHDVTMSLTLRDALRIAALPDSKRQVDLSRLALFSDPIFTPYDERVRQRVKSEDAFPVLVRLKSTRDETNAIAGLFKPRNVLNYTGEAASRENALSPAVMQASVLHFATHAVASDTWPTGSGLQLTGFMSDGKPVNGFVSSLDLLSRRTTTSLVVLSACDTARGDAAPGENVAGLARAFLGGGARRVVGSLWAVDDTVTAGLMTDFYAGLVAGETPAVALAGAQRKIAGPAVPGQRPPWAAFLLYERAP